MPHSPNYCACTSGTLTSKGLANALVTHAHPKQGKVRPQLPHHLQGDA